MVKLGTKLASAIEPQEGQNYRITTAEAITTLVQGFQGVRVLMKTLKKGDDTEYATVLWQRETAGSTSKLGAFLSAFEQFYADYEKARETDTWVNHDIRIITWQPRKREVKVLK